MQHPGKRPGPCPGELLPSGLDGTTGNIYAGQIKTVDATIAGEFGRVMAWADKYRKLKVRTNADTPEDAKKARELVLQG